jgi:2-methylfumaryl-CoA hydratase
VKNQPASNFPLRNAEGRYDPAVLLDLDWWGLVPRRAADIRSGQ